MKVLDIKMEKRVGGLERPFRDGISKLLIDNGDEWGGSEIIGDSKISARPTTKSDSKETEEVRDEEEGK